MIIGIDLRPITPGACGGIVPLVKGLLELKARGVDFVRLDDAVEVEAQ